MEDESRVAPGFYTINDVAKILKVHHQKVRELIRNDELRAHRIGRIYRVSVENLKLYLESTEGK